jgi:exodeoxyribonuclease VII small subunit
MTEAVKEDLSFEAAMKELDEIVGRLEKGNVKLDDALKDYERGAKLRLHCAKKLNEAKAKIEKIEVGSDGKISTAPFDAEPAGGP